MKSINNILVKKNTPLKEVINVINKSSTKIVYVVTNNNTLLGSISDGDIRRRILKKELNSLNASNVMNKKPIFLFENQKADQSIFDKGVVSIPLINKKKKILDIITPNNLINFNNFKNEETIIIMAGGKGKRLSPITSTIPKPLIKINNQKTILDLIFEKLTKENFYHFQFNLNYKYQMIKEHIKKKYGNKNFKISFNVEDKFLGTAGSLFLIKNVSKNFVVINSDIYSSLNINEIINFHKNKKNFMTILTHEFQYQIPYGIVSTKNNQTVKGVDEKPIKKDIVLSGVYVFKSEVLKFFNSKKYIDMPDLINFLAKKNKKIGFFLNNEYWIDIGNISELNRAKKELFNI